MRVVVRTSSYRLTTKFVIRREKYPDAAGDPMSSQERLKDLVTAEHQEQVRKALEEQNKYLEKIQQTLEQDTKQENSNGVSIYVVIPYSSTVKEDYNLKNDSSYTVNIDLDTGGDDEYRSERELKQTRKNGKNSLLNSDSDQIFSISKLI
ncbi:hypothetical protein PGB90_004467 [Kerria lacca]